MDVVRCYRIAVRIRVVKINCYGAGQIVRIIPERKRAAGLIVFSTSGSKKNSECEQCKKQLFHSHDIFGRTSPMQQMTTASDSCTRDIRYIFTEIAACLIPKSV